MDSQKLIDFVFVRPSLWDQKDKNYHNRYILDKLWDEVAKEMNCTRDQARNKWKNLRDTFRREVHKNPCRSGDPGGKPVKSSWPFFENLLFLQDQFTPRPSSGNLSTAQNDILIDESESHQDIENDSVVSEPFSPPTSTTRAQSRCSSDSSTSFTIVRGKKRKVADDFGQQLLDIEKQKLMQCNEINDEDVGFFNSLLPHVKKLTPQKKMQLRMKILSLVYNVVYPDANEITLSRTTTEATICDPPISNSSVQYEELRPTPRQRESTSQFLLRPESMSCRDLYDNFEHFN